MLVPCVHARSIVCASFISLVAIEAVGCFKLDDIFDCAALCDDRPHARTTCTGAGCVFQGCDDGYADCNGDTKDGCEVDLRSDRDHCGVCGRSCSSTDCVLGSCWPIEPLLGTRAFVSAICVDETSLYFARDQVFPSTDAGVGGDGETAETGADAGSGSTVVERMPLATRVRTTLASGLDSVVTLAPDTDAIYAVARSFTSGSDGGDRVLRIAQVGGTAETLATTRVTSAHLTLDATNVYWGGQAASGVRFVAKSGGTMQTLPTPMLPDPAYALSPVYDLASRGDLLYLASHGGVSAVPSTGGALAILAQGTRAFGISLDATDAYFIGITSVGTPYALQRVPLSGGDAMQLWQNGGEPREPVVRKIVSDQDAVYLARLQSVVRVLKATGDATVLAGAQSCVTDIAVDADYVYWSGCLGVRRLAKQHIAP
jgi:hypothetical protein